MSTLTCSACQYENVVVTCGFCLQCGIDIEVDGTGGCGSPPTSKHPTAVQRVAEAVAQHSGSQPVDEGDSWAVRVSLSNGRQQVAHFESANGSPTDEVSFFSICGPAIERNALPLMIWNERLEDGYFAARTIHGKRMYVLKSRNTYSKYDTLSIVSAVQSLVQLADTVEAKISAGADVF
jgi:hypothetical protein